MDERVCPGCGFTPTGTPREHDGGTYCHGPGVPEPTCWQLAAAGGRVVQADLGQDGYDDSVQA